MSNISRRSFVAASSASLLSVFLGACSNDTAADSGSDGDAAAAAGTHIYVLTASPDHGWTGQVGVFAQEKVDEINAAGTYTAELQTAGAAADQIAQVEDILAGNLDDIAGIVIQPLDDTLQSAIQSIADAGVPYVAFDRIIEAVQDSAVANVKGDNEGIGAGSAAYFVENGMQPGDAVYIYQGDTSSVTTLRDNGFTEYLLGNLEFNGSTVPEDQKWTQEQIDSAITKSGAMNWSRSDTKAAFESLLGDEANAKIKWWYAEDDELAMGILEALNGGGISDSAKEAFYATKPFITGCGGLKEYYDVIGGESYQDIVTNLGGVMSVTYSPSMIQTAIQDMVDYLDGKEVTQDHVIACENVTSENVDEYVGFE
ncbi:substrate-binding domain-containing protein [Thermophilibacter sp.]